MKIKKYRKKKKRSTGVIVQVQFLAMLMTTVKQKLVAQKVSKGMSIKGAMLEAGYSPACARTSKVTKMKGFKELMEKYIPDSLLMEKHQELLMVPRIKRVYLKGDLQSEIEEVDSQAIGKGLDMAYKLKGSYAAEKHEITVPKPILDLPDEKNV